MAVERIAKGIFFFFVKFTSAPKLSEAVLMAKIRPAIVYDKYLFRRSDLTRPALFAREIPVDGDNTYLSVRIIIQAVYLFINAR